VGRACHHACTTKQARQGWLVVHRVCCNSTAEPCLAAVLTGLDRICASTVASLACLSLGTTHCLLTWLLCTCPAPPSSPSVPRHFLLHAGEIIAIIHQAALDAGLDRLDHLKHLFQRQPVKPDTHEDGAPRTVWDIVIRCASSAKSAERQDPEPPAAFSGTQAAAAAAAAAAAYGRVSPIPFQLEQQPAAAEVEAAADVAAAAAAAAEGLSDLADLHDQGRISSDAAATGRMDQGVTAAVADEVSKGGWSSGSGSHGSDSHPDSRNSPPSVDSRDDEAVLESPVTAGMRLNAASESSGGSPLSGTPSQPPELPDLEDGEMVQQEEAMQHPGMQPADMYGHSHMLAQPRLNLLPAKGGVDYLLRTSDEVWMSFQKILDTPARLE